MQAGKFYLCLNPVVFYLHASVFNSISCLLPLSFFPPRLLNAINGDSLSEHQMMVEAWAKKEMAQKKLAVCYFRLMMDLKREHHCPYHK